MKEEWKVYIKGVPGKGNEVIKMLTDLGAVNGGHCEGEYPSTLYYINHDGFVDYTFPGTEEGQIIMDNYRELHLPEKWKDGDLLVCHMLSGNRYAVYSNDSELMKCNTIITYANVDNHTYGVNVLFDKEDFTLASDEEHKEFYDLLHKHGVDWNAEKKQLIDWKWKPKDGEDYYYIISNGIVHLSTWFDYKVDNSRFSIGNCFKTKEEAEIMAEKFIKLLKGKS